MPLGAAVVTLLAIVTAVGVGLTPAPAIIALVVAVLDGALLLSRAWSLHVARTRHEVKNRGTRYGWLVAGSALLVVAAGVLPWVDPEIRRHVRELIGGAPARAWPYHGMVLTILIGAATVHVSAMVDWAFIRLRLLGLLGDWTLPCQSAKHTESTNWPLLTRLWLGHRLVAYVVVRVGIVALTGFIAAAIVDPIGFGVSSADRPGWIQPAATALGAITAAILIFFINRLLPSWTLLLNARVSVGDRIVLAEEFGTGVTTRPIYFVVDIAVEGLKLIELGEGDQPFGSAGRDPRREHDRSLTLTDLPRLLRFRGRFSACDEVCCRAQHYCPLGYGDPVAWPRGAEAGAGAVGRSAEPEGLYRDGADD